MAHVHGTASLAVPTKHITQAGAAKATEHGVAGMLAQGSAKAAPGAVSFHNVASGAAITATSHTGRSLMSRLIKNPWVLFGAGIALGYVVHKYRKDIIGTANRVAEKGKDFVLQQRENLEDIIAESGESQE